MAIEYGLLPTGFRRKRLPEILRDLNERLSDKLGIEIQSGANSVIGQIHGVYAHALAEIWEEIEKTYFAMYPSTADGVSLSNSAGLAGIEQISAEQSTIVATCYGNEGTVIPYNAQIASSNDSSQVFANRETNKKISVGRACEVHLSIPSVEIGKLYKISIDGEPSIHTASDSDSAEIIFESLIEQFTTIRKFDNRTFEISDGKLIIKMNDSAEEFSLTTTLQVEKIGSPFLFECLNYGAINPAIGTVTQIITNCSGWLEVSNNRETSVGRDAETTTQLRQRWSASVYSRSIAMTDSIAAAIYQQCRGVTYVRVYENTADYTDREGRPPHCVEVVIEGGDPQEICDVIFQKKSGGIDTFGDISRAVFDIQGIAHSGPLSRIRTQMKF